MIVDVSIHNGRLDWSKVKSSGVTGAIVRCGYGRDFTKQDDARFYENMDGALAQGLKVGVYIYSYAKSEDSARSEAAHVLRLANKYKDKITLPIYYDLEENGTESGAKERAVIFGDIIERAGYTCGVYASSYWWRTHLKGLNRFTKWVADWGVNNGKPNNKPSIEGVDLWQYTSNGKINGISGRVDLNEAYGKIAEIIEGNSDNNNNDNNNGGIKTVDITLKVLEYGAKDVQVGTVQTILKQKGYKVNSKVLKIDNDFGSNTLKAVKDFQTASGLNADGIVGFKTWNKLLKE